MKEAVIKVESCTQSAGAAVWWLTGEQEMGVGTQHAQDRTQQNSVDFITPLRTVHVDALWIHYFWNFPYVIFREWLKPQKAILWLRWELPWLLRCKYCTNQILSHWPEFHQIATRSQKKAAGHVFFFFFFKILCSPTAWISSLGREKVGTGEELTDFVTKRRKKSEYKVFFFFFKIESS